MSRRAIPVMLAAALILAVAIPRAARSAPAPAALLLPAGCVYGGSSADFRVEGLAPNHAYSVSGGSKTLASGTTDASGQADGQLRAPALSLAARRVTLTAGDGTGALATATLDVTAFDAYLTPPDGSVRRAVRVSLFGWEGKTVYVHYLPAGAKRATRTVRIARTGGLCGSARVRLRHLFPFAPHAGVWRLVFDSRRGYRGAARPRVVYRTTVI